MGPCPLSPGAGLWVGGTRRLDGQYYQLPRHQYASQWLSSLPGGLGPSLGGPCSPQPLSSALLSAPDHHGLLLCGLPPGTGQLRPEPQTKAKSSLGGWWGPTHAAALLGTLQCLQCGRLPAPRLGRLLAEAGAPHRCLERRAQPIGDWLLGTGAWPGDIMCGKNKRGYFSEVVATAGGGGTRSRRAGLLLQDPGGDCSKGTAGQPCLGTLPEPLTRRTELGKTAPQSERRMKARSWVAGER